MTDQRYGSSRQSRRASVAIDADVAFGSLAAELRLLLDGNRIGRFDHVELVEVVGTPRGGETLNVLSVAVLAEGRTDIGSEQPRMLTGRIAIDGFEGWSFGVARVHRPISALVEALDGFPATRRWALSGRTLAVGNLHPEPPMFAPPDGTASVPLNGVLKNNFWAGSHVFRLVDRNKVPFAPFFADRRRIQALSDAVSIAVPLAFAGLADVLGDVLVQVPVTQLIPGVHGVRGHRHSDVSVTWRRDATPRTLVMAARTGWDEMVAGAAISEPFTHSVRLAINNHHRPLETEIFDAETGILVGATTSTSVLRRIQVGTHVAQHEPRLFTSRDVDGRQVSQRIAVVESGTRTIGEEAVHDAEHWRGLRQDLEERRRLDESRDFVQYRPASGSLNERSRAMADLRLLIERHGDTGVDLWDPYLSAEDLLQTLFWSPHVDAPLRALSDGRDTPGMPRPTLPDAALVAADETFPAMQRSTLERDGGNCVGLRLEFRSRRGPKGWHFHDRFLIFPNMRDGPRAWSLGTSVNSLGLAHHILQRVSNPVMVAGAFEDLWMALDEPQHVVWRSR